MPADRSLYLLVLEMLIVVSSPAASGMLGQHDRNQESDLVGEERQVLL